MNVDSMDFLREAVGSGLVTTLLGALAVMTILYYDRIKLDPREPPIVAPTIPIFGHLLGMVMHGSRYFKSLE